MNNITCNLPWKALIKPVASTMSTWRKLWFWMPKKTLVAEDTGLLRWKTYFRVNELHDRVCTLKEVFSSPLKYSYLAFRQVALMYEAANDEDFGSICSTTAEAVTIHSEFAALLHQVSKCHHIRAQVSKRTSR
ncbi:hypothetical protein BJX96DRAFT_147309 [Aspergillus floccosus]